MKRVNISIDDEIHRKAKVIAVLKGITLNQYFESAIEQALKKESGLRPK
jgi:predicted HicB family RNase H-like nuclease